ncbi:MAG: putative ski2-type helicase [Candidatus Heimdallarchaeota archaeon LC_2]|nr:MAG: putative ski2-type helicase [Candidatus Heimdallarchaeota archaeon LC_2]
MANLIVFKYTKNSSKEAAIHKGRISFTYDKRKLRPFRYEQRSGHSYRFRSEKVIMKILQDATMIIMTPNDKPENIPEYLEFFESKKMLRPKIMDLCIRCLQEYSQMSQLNKNNKFQLYKKSICRPCAVDELQEEYTRRGISLTSSSKKFYQEQLNKYKSLDKVIENLWDPQTSNQDRSTSLFDVVPADTKSRNIEFWKFIKSKKMEKLFDKEIVQHWKKLGINEFLPVQQMAISNGLLELNDLLVVAGTSSGKTFVGEIAGIHNWKSRGKKFVFTTPLVALSNQKYESFKSRYRKLGARVALRVGKSKIDVGDEEKIFPDGNFAKSDIIVATYEALDWIFRSGQWKNIGEIGTFVVDEVQLLSDPERGILLDGILARVKTLFPKCQIICLSATIGNPQILANELGLDLVNYMKRPIALERHLIIAKDKEEREKLISDLVKEEAKIVSKSNYKGQSLIFTSSRRRVQELASVLKSEGRKSAYYHAGMTYSNRRKIESKFEKGEIEVLTTTAALGAGADFPVSQVIFELPAMGARWITNAEFHQMSGRAGRLGYHDLGKAVMFVIPGEKIYSAQQKSSDQVAFEILTGEIEDIEGDVDSEDEMEQILAYVSSSYPLRIDAIASYHKKLFYNTNSLSSLIKVMNSKGLITIKDNLWYITPLGRAISSSFLKPLFGYDIAKKTTKMPVIDVALEIAPNNSILLTSQMHSQIERAMKTNLSRNFLSDGVLDFIVGTSLKSKKLPLTLIEKVKQWNRLFFNCSCKSNPYCIHPKMKLSKLVLDLRLSGMNLSQISYQLSRSYDLFIFPGDLLNWLDEIIHAIQSVARIAKAMNQTSIITESKNLALAIQSANPNVIDKNTKLGLNWSNQKQKLNQRPLKRKVRSRKNTIARKQAKNSKISRRK